MQLKEIFKEYDNKNTALILIEESNSIIEDFLKTNIMGKNINKNLQIKNSNLSEEQFYIKIIDETKNEIINLVKSQNLIDIRTPHL